ncbi:MAG: MFS transporter [Nocardioidaceae bacterium]
MTQQIGTLLLLAAGLAVRAAAPTTAAFIGASVVALAGMATANVLVPSLVKRHFPGRIGLLTGVYTTVLSLGLTLAGTLTAPITEASGSWRVGFAVWAGTALLAAIPWLGLVSHDSHPEPLTHGVITTRRLVRSSLAWSMAVFFGCQSLQAYVVFGWLPQVYRDAGFSANEAGLLLGVTTATSIPMSFVLPGLAARLRHQGPLILALCMTYLIGYGGLIIAPVEGAVAWALLIGTGTAIFPLALLLIGAEVAVQRRHGGPLRLHPERGIPPRGHRPVRRGGDLRRYARMDLAAPPPHGGAGAARGDRLAARQAEVRRGRARAAYRTLTERDALTAPGHEP